jgi:hypothetical protein
LIPFGEVFNSEVLIGALVRATGEEKTGNPDLTVQALGMESFSTAFHQSKMPQRFLVDGRREILACRWCVLRTTSFECHPDNHPSGKGEQDSQPKY